jgi:hypothetical protein
MLKLLGVSFSTDFTGGTLALQSGRFQVRDSTGTTVVRDATSSGVMLNFEAGESDYVLQETGNEAKDTYNGLGLCTTKAGYADLKGNQFVLSGVKQQTAKESNGKWTYSFIFNGSGTGYINTPPAGMEPLPLFIITGTLDGKSQ